MSGNEKFGLGMAALAALILYLLQKKGLLHESVTSTIGGVPITSSNTIPPDPATGFPMFDQNVAASIPAGEEFAVMPIASDGTLTWNPSNPKAASCPMGYRMWKNATDGSYECIPFS